MTEEEFSKLQIGDRIKGTIVGVHEIANIGPSSLDSIAYILKPEGCASVAWCWDKVDKNTPLGLTEQERRENELCEWNET